MKFNEEEQWVLLRMLEQWLDRLPQCVLTGLRARVKAELHARYRTRTAMGYRACPCRGPEGLN